MTILVKLDYGTLSRAWPLLDQTSLVMHVEHADVMFYKKRISVHKCIDTSPTL